METELGRVVLMAEDRRQRDLPEPIYLSTSPGNGGRHGCMKDEKAQNIQDTHPNKQLQLSFHQSL